MKTKGSRLEIGIQDKLSGWSIEAMIQLCVKGAAGIKLHRETWANGEVMVGWEGALANQFVPLADAIACYRAGWKIVN